MPRRDLSERRLRHVHAEKKYFTAGAAVLRGWEWGVRAICVQCDLCAMRRGWGAKKLGDPQAVLLNAHSVC